MEGYRRCYQKVVVCKDCGDKILSVTVSKEAIKFGNFINIELFARCVSCQESKVYDLSIREEF